jgi:hypothetical protein
MSLTFNSQLNSISAGTTSALDLSNNQAMNVAKGNSAGRTGAEVTGAMRYNTDTNLIEFWNGTAWVSSPIFDPTNGTVNTMPYFASGTTSQAPVVPALTPLSPFSRGLLAGTDGAAWRTALQTANLLGANEWQGPNYSRIVTITSTGQTTGFVTGSVVVDLSIKNNYIFSLAGNITMAPPINGQQGQSGVIIIGQSSSTARTITWDPVWKFPNGEDPAMSTTLGAICMVSYIVSSSSYIIANFTKDYN